MRKKVKILKDSGLILALSIFIGAWEASAGQIPEETMDSITDTISFDAVGDRAAIQIGIDTVAVNSGATLRDSLLSVSYYCLFISFSGL